MNLNIIIVGYYNHYNAGDEQYKSSFVHLFHHFLHTPFNIQFVDCDTLCNHSVDPQDIIILGGGDILNEYFIDKIIAKFHDAPNKIIAVSVGLPYNRILIQTQKLQVIDFLFIRTQQDKELFEKYFHHDRIFYMPDLSYYLLEQEDDARIYKNTIHENVVEKLKHVTHKEKRKIVCFSLNRHIYKAKYVGYYQIIVGELAKVIMNLIDRQYYIVFLPFNTIPYTSIDKCSENDVIIHNDVIVNMLFSKLGHSVSLMENILNIETAFRPSEMLSLYEYFHVTIPMRFHACLYSVYKGVPMVPVFTTKKIHNLLKDIDAADLGYELSKNEVDIPIYLDAPHLLSKIDVLVENPKRHALMRKQMASVCKDTFAPILRNMSKKLIHIMLTPYPKKSYDARLAPKFLSFSQIKDRLNAFAREHDHVENFQLVTSPESQHLVSKMISYYLTKRTDSPYLYGIQNKLYENPNPAAYNLDEEWKWIVEDDAKTKCVLPNYPFGLYNITFIDQIDYTNAHRSGWQYVYDHIKRYHHEDSDVYLDLYLDRTFHWEKTLYKSLGIIPYQKNWVGFVHHTFEKYFSNYNAYHLLRDPDFVASLPHCKRLIVLSKHLKQRFIEEFRKHGMADKMPVIDVLMHPTEVDVHSKFTWEAFCANPDKKIVHIGGWLRNIFSFYSFQFPRTLPAASPFQFPSLGSLATCFSPESTTIRKVALKGHSMNNYYPEEDFLDDMRNALITISPKASTFLPNSMKKCSQHEGEGFSFPIITNNWYKHFFQFLREQLEEVEVIDKISNEDYDTLLSENIVFLNLIEPSAVNTLIECIVRNTPVVVNKHPAVVELLGEDYPLYYKNDYTSPPNMFEMNVEIVGLMSMENIKRGYHYLCNMNKEHFTIEYFMREFLEIMNGIFR